MQLRLAVNKYTGENLQPADVNLMLSQFGNPHTQVINQLGFESAVVHKLQGQVDQKTGQPLMPRLKASQEMLLQPQKKRAGSAPVGGGEVGGLGVGGVGASESEKRSEREVLFGD